MSDQDEKEYKFPLRVLNIGFTNDKVPQFLEKKGKEYVYYGETNDYPQYLVLLFNRSAKHNAIVTSKQLYITGKGFTYDPSDIDEKMQIKMQAFLNNPNPYETLDDIMTKTVLDYELFGGFYLRIIGNKAKNDWAEIYHNDYCEVRSNEDNTEFYISDNWINEDGSQNLQPTIKKTLKPYNPKKVQSESMLYVKMYRPNLRTYTLPDYIGAVPYLITDAEIANFHRAEIQNSFKGSKMIVFKNGLPALEEMAQTERKLKAKFNPTDRAGSIVVDFVDDPNKVPEVLDLSAGDFADKYNALNDTVQQEIFVGHKTTSPMLFGVRVEGQLGGRNEMVDAYNLFQNTYAQPRQRVQEKIYDIFAPVKGKLKIKPLEPIMPSFSENILMQILTTNEMREVIGRKEMDKAKNPTGEINPALSSRILNAMTANEYRAMVGKPSLPGGDVLPNSTATESTFTKEERKQNDQADYAVFAKYGEPIENYEKVRDYKHGFAAENFALTDVEQAVLDLIKKTPGITQDGIQDVTKLDKTAVSNILESLTGEGYIKIKDGNISATASGKKEEGPTFGDLFVRYRYVLRSDAPDLVAGGSSRAFCKAMMDNPRYFTREEIDQIGQELGQLYDIPNYDAFRRRGGWYHDPEDDVNYPYCRHVWVSELVKKVR